MMPPATSSQQDERAGHFVSVLSAVEKRRTIKVKKDDTKAVELPLEDMSGELQTIPARHGVATFVPRGRTIKVINTYGKQVVSMWAFSLGAPPEKDGEDEEVDEEKVKEEAEGLKMAVEAGAGDEAAASLEEGEKKSKESEEKMEDGKSKEAKTVAKDVEDLPEHAPDAQENEKPAENTEASSKQGSKRTWASYLPSIPYRNKGATSTPDTEKPNAEEQEAQNEANTKKWSSYIPTGKSFSSYVPNMQIPDSKEAVSSFKASHYRDPNKSYAEQLYDFSKTPVGAGTIAGSGYASSVYAAYSAYASTHPSSSSQPPMEYLSLPHTRASSHKLVPEVTDLLLTNLRNPILTLIEDTSPGAHDTLTAACDANQYLALGVPKPSEHGSCAENLVLALKELNTTAGLKGAKAIGADISVNIAPTPLHLFMNAPLHFEHADPQGAGARGITLHVDEPVGKKRSFVRFRAERDVVVVLSACPMDVGKQNGGRCMAANFMVEQHVAQAEDSSASVVAGGGKGDGEMEQDGHGKGGEMKKGHGSTSEQKQGKGSGNMEEINGGETGKQERIQDGNEHQLQNSTRGEDKPDTRDSSDAAQTPQATSLDPSVSQESKPKAKKKPRKLQTRSGSGSGNVPEKTA
ncbi:hypothetical protein J1614_007481 [Plenodomus biglobosus]|nr:hypothetical protein J1614_007481 [Plenodomus biglobosus]